MNPRSGSHSVPQLQVQLGWSTKYGYQVLTGEGQLRCRDLLRQTCHAQDVHLLKGVVSKDPIYLPVSSPPALSLRDLVRRLKGRSAKLLLPEFPELKCR